MKNILIIIKIKIGGLLISWGNKISGQKYEQVNISGWSGDTKITFYDTKISYHKEITWAQVKKIHSEQPAIIRNKATKISIKLTLLFFLLGYSCVLVVLSEFSLLVLMLSPCDKIFLYHRKLF